MTSPVDVAKLRALCDAASPGPWEAGVDVVGPEGEEWEIFVLRSSTVSDLAGVDGCSAEFRRDDTVLIAAARTALPACLDEIERLRSALTEALDAWGFLDPLEDRVAELRKLVTP